jgi:hypothetical protein
MAASIADLQGQMQELTARLDTLAAGWQPVVASGQPLGDSSATYDTSKFVLGPLCPRRHAYQNTGQTLRRLSSHSCPACDVEKQRERRQGQQQRAVSAEQA